MKKVLLLILFTFAILKTNAQSESYTKTDSLPVVYLGLGTGINSYTGLVGVSGNLRIYKKFFIQGGIGIGSWGTKRSIGLRFDRSYGKGWSYGIGISNCSGLKDFEYELELKDRTTKKVRMDCLETNTFNLKATHNWKLGRFNTFYLEIGYAIALKPSPWKITDGSVISNSSEAALNMASPGGLLFGLGITIGI